MADAAVAFTDARVDDGPGGELAQAMRDEIAEMYGGLELDGDSMPRAGPAELSPPGGAFIVGWLDGAPVCCGGVKRLDGTTCEIKKMYVIPSMRGRGVARTLLRALEKAKGNDKKDLLKIIKNKGIKHNEILKYKNIYLKLGILNDAEREIEKYTKLALNNLSALPNEEGKILMHWLANFLINRNK